MNALIVSHAAIKSANRRIYRSLSQRGVNVTVVIPDAWKSGLGPVRAEAEPGDSPLHVVTCKRIGISHSNVYCLQSFDRIAREVQPDAIYVDEDPAGFVAAQAARATSRHRTGLVVLAIQNLVKRYPPPFNALQQYVFNRAHVAVSVSEQAASTLRARGFRGPMRAMPFCTDLLPPSGNTRERVRREYAFEGPTVGYVGRLVTEKGVDTFLRALALLPDVTGAIVGDGPERDALEHLAASLGLTGRVRFLGAQPPKTAERLVGAFDAIALPSRTRQNWSEQFGRILIEAMASGVCVVASDSGAISEVLGNAGILVREDDFAELASGLTRALDPISARTLRERGIARVAEHFSPAIETNALYNALEFSAAQGATT
jgi:glycosyltransferase involved in cell wall biosynthesis